MGSSFSSFTQNRNVTPGSTAANTGQNAPLKAVDTQQYAYSNFIYPLDLGAEGAGKDHMMVFHINETSTTFFKTATVNGNAPTGKPTIVNNSEINKAAGKGSTVSGAGSGTPPTGQQGAVTHTPLTSSLKQPIQRVATTIVLYMPQDIQTHYQSDWESVELGAAGDIVAAIQQAGKGHSITDALRSIGASELKGLGTAFSEITNMSFGNALSRAGRLVINPHAEVVFNGIGFRQFNFSFRFTPENEDEALNVDNIIRAFKFYSAPEILKGTAGRFWIYPAEFDIEYWSNGKPNDFLNKISTCALVDMTVNYTASGQWSAHRPHSVIDGQAPVCTDISLVFKELELVTKERVLEGY